MTCTTKSFLSKYAALAALAAVLSACSLTPLPPVNLPSRSDVQPGQEITVLGNENVYGIARKYNVSMRELIVLNNLRAPFGLRAGQKLTLPADHVASGDSFTHPGYASGNTGGAGGQPSSPYSPGSYSSDRDASGPAPAAPVSAAPGSVESSELPPVEPGPVSSAPLDAPQTTAPAPQATHAPQTIYNNAPQPAPTTSSSPVSSLNAPIAPPRPVTTTADNGAEAASAAASPPSSVSFAWPVQGPVVSSFGPKGQGLSNDGVNISAPKGSPVEAAGNGIVVYAGNEMKGFGNLVLIRHQGGWVTAYAHLDRVLITKDAVVAKGDEIGTVGKTGDVTTPQLHFETRYNGKPVDPAGVVKDQAQ